MKTPFGYYWEILHKKTGDVINSGFSKDPMEVGEKPTSIKGFVCRTIPLYGGCSTNLVETKAKIAAKMKEIKQFALTEDEQFWQEEKRYAKERGISDLGSISDAIKQFAKGRK